MINPPEKRSGGQSGGRCEPDQVSPGTDIFEIQYQQSEGGGASGELDCERGSGAQSAEDRAAPGGVPESGEPACDGEERDKTFSVALPDHGQCQRGGKADDGHKADDGAHGEDGRDVVPGHQGVHGVAGGEEDGDDAADQAERDVDEGDDGAPDAAQ